MWSDVLVSSPADRHAAYVCKDDPSFDSGLLPGGKIDLRRNVCLLLLGRSIVDWCGCCCARFDRDTMHPHHWGIVREMALRLALEVALGWVFLDVKALSDASNGALKHSELGPGR